MICTLPWHFLLAAINEVAEIMNSELTKGEPFARFFAAADLGPERSLAGCAGALGAVCLAGLAFTPGVKLLITRNEERAKDLARQVAVWLGSRTDKLVCMLPERRSIYDQTAADPELLAVRLRAMALEKSGGGLIIAPATVILERFFAPEKWKNSCFTIEAGAVTSRDELIGRLVASGYQRVNVVEEHSTFAVRGSLLDIFPPNVDNPVRLDFFVEELDSIKLFAASTQRSFDKRDRFLLVPACEYIADSAEIAAIIDRVAEEIGNLDERRSLLLARRHEHLLAHADSRDYKELRPFVEKGAGYLWDYWSECRILLEDGNELFSVFEEIFTAFLQQHQQLNDLTPLLPPHYYYHHWTALGETLAAQKTASFSRFSDPDNNMFAGIEFMTPPTDPSRETLLRELRQLLEAGWAIAIVIEDETRLHNLRGLLGDRKIRIHSSTQPFGVKSGSVLFNRGYCRRGFKDFTRRIAVYAEEDIYPGPARESSGRRHSTQQNILHLQQMVPGDIVVHADHGVAEFRGIQTMTAGGHTREYILLQYAGTDRLYVPTDQVHKVTRYLGMEGYVPRIHSLNSKVWSSQKSKVSKNVELIARELLELYAQRHASTGFAFSDGRAFSLH
jgi:transcription-repair coupling factor (superfamily II helicase)